MKNYKNQQNKNLKDRNKILQNFVKKILTILESYVTIISKGGIDNVTKLRKKNI